MGRPGRTSAWKELLALKARIRSCGDSAELSRLRKREIGLLAKMGNLPEAARRARAALEDEPHDPVLLSTLGDVLARSEAWTESLMAFREAAGSARELGDENRSERILLGPVYRIAEALVLYDVCRQVAESSGAELAHALRRRLARLSRGAPPRGLHVPETGLASWIWCLEDCWAGSSRLPDLLDIAGEWPPSEPEWRWRVIAEGWRVSIGAGLPSGRWKRLARDTQEPVLDPRFRAERSEILR
ncbi:hypothetical protein JW921_06130 [Candidatus Fermentibacterales bacterium]|nr:hypothetical protein [Candidatus Fermentibacterales bacterium]